MSEPGKFSLKRAESVAVAGLIIQAALSLIGYLCWRYSLGPSVLAETRHLVVGIFLWIVILIYQRFKRAAEEEALEIEELSTRRESERPEGGSLFEEGRLDTFTAASRLERFEKYAGPVLSVIVGLGLLWPAAQAVIAWVFKGIVPTQSLGYAAPVRIDHAGAAAVVFIGGALVAFMLAKYAAGMATQKAWRPLRAGASFLMGNAVAMLLVIGVLALDFFGVNFGGITVDLVLAWIIPVATAVVGIEILLTVLLDLYRPRLKDQEIRLAYDSRLQGLLTERGGLLHTAAEAMNYQFGFKVSDTWFYRFMERAIAPLILFQVLTFWGLSSMFIVGPGEAGFLLRWGVVQRDAAGKPVVLEPGLHFKRPWPFDRIVVCRTDDIRQLVIGEQYRVNKKTGEKYRTALWTEYHGPADTSQNPFVFLVATKEVAATQPTGTTPPSGQPQKETTPPPVIFLTGRVFVQYKVTDPYRYLFTVNEKGAGEAQVRKLIEDVCYRECSKYLARVDIMEFLTSGRQKAAEALREDIQKMIGPSGMNLGAEITTVSLAEVHPPLGQKGGMTPGAGGGKPTSVAGAYEYVAGAQVLRKTSIVRGRTDALGLLTDGQIGAFNTRQEADRYGTNKLLVAEAGAKRFKARVKAWNAAPKVFPYLEYTREMAATFKDKRKFIYPDWVTTSSVTILDMANELPGIFGSFGEK